MHPPSETLARFVDGTLSEDERAAVTAELARCAECRAVVGALARRASELDVTAIPQTLDHAAPPPEEPSAVGAIVGGRYRVVRKLGEGGMGVVYEVEHALLGRRFALKTLHAALASRGDAVRRFLGEARALAALGHEGIVEVLDMGSDEAGTPFLVMPMLRGESLEERLEREPMPPLELALDLGAQLARALAFAHERGVVHRDIKPANVFVLEAEAGELPRLKLLDFGIAKLLDPDTTRTSSGVMLGTPRYMAPEQWSRPREVDARVDVFAWGTTLYRMLTGELPYAWADVVEGRGDAPRPDVRALRPEVPIALAEIVERALSLSPSRRQGDAGALVAALSAARPQRSSVRPVAVRPSVEPSLHATVGRDVELDRIEAWLARGRVVVVTGAAGIGKSAVLDALARRWTRAGVQEGGVGRTVVLARRAVDPHLPFAILRAVLEGTQREAAGQREDALALALRARLSGVGLVLVDDAEGLDEPSLALLASLRAEDGAGPALVLASGEAGATRLLERFAAGAPGAERVDLAGLDSGAVRSLMSLRGPVDEGSLSQMISRTAGHPLFVLQCLALGALDSDDARTTPRRLGDVVLSRLEAAPEHAALGWQAAAVLASAPGAVIGPFDLAALGTPRPEDALAWLLREGVLAAAPGGYRFTSDVLSEAVLSSLPDAARTERHREAATLRSRDLAVDAEPRRWAEVAHHLELGGEPAAASDAYARAVLGTRAIALVEGPEPTASAARPTLGLRQDLAFEAAVAWAARAIALAERAGKIRFDTVDLTLVEIEALEARGRFADVVARIGTLLPSLRGAREARALVLLGTALQRSGEAARALEIFERAVATARASDERERDGVLAQALGRHAVALGFAGRVDDARDVLDEAEPLVLTRAPDLRPDLAGWKAQIAGISGDLGERREAYWAAEQLFRASGNVRFAAFSLLNLGDTYARLGAYDEAERALVRAHAECEALGATVMTGYAAINLAQACLRLGRAGDALVWLDRAREIVRRTREPRLGRYVTLYAAELAVSAAGREALDVDAALAELDRLLPSEGTDASVAAAGALDASFLASALTVLARAELSRFRATEDVAALGRAQALVERARALLDEVGGLEEGESELCLVTADVLEARGEVREAREVLREGARRLRQAARRIGGALFRGHYLEDVAAHRELLARSAEP